MWEPHKIIANRAMGLRNVPGVVLGPIELNRQFRDQAHDLAQDKELPANRAVVQRLKDPDSGVQADMATMRLDGSKTSLDAICDCLCEYGDFLSRGGDPAGDRILAELKTFRANVKADVNPETLKSLQQSYEHMLKSDVMSFHTAMGQEIKPKLSECPPAESTLVVGSTKPTLKETCQLVLKMWAGVGRPAAAFTPTGADLRADATASDANKKSGFGNPHAAFLGRRSTPGRGLPIE